MCSNKSFPQGCRHVTNWTVQNNAQAPIHKMVTVMMSAMQRAHHPKKSKYISMLCIGFDFFMIHWSGLCSIYWLIWGGLLGTPYSCLVNAFHWHKRCYWEQWSQVNFNRKIRNKFQWNLNQKSNISIWWNACVANKCQKQGVSLCKFPAGGLNQSWGGESELGLSAAWPKVDQAE